MNAEFSGTKMFATWTRTLDPVWVDFKSGFMTKGEADVKNSLLAVAKETEIGSAQGTSVNRFVYFWRSLNYLAPILMPPRWPFANWTSMKGPVMTS